MIPAALNFRATDTCRSPTFDVLPDTDMDGYLDGYEVSTGFDPSIGTSVPDTLSSLITAVEFRFPAPLGKTYKIQSSTNLTEWDDVETDIVGTGGSIVRFYSIEGIPQRSFRAVEQ